MSKCLNAVVFLFHIDLQENCVLHIKTVESPANACVISINYNSQYLQRSFQVFHQIGIKTYD